MTTEPSPSPRLDDPRLPRNFLLVRNEDATGISGTGVVAQGTEYHDGTVTMVWCTRIASVEMFRSVAEVEALHGHEGRSVVRWLPEQQQVAL